MTADVRPGRARFLLAGALVGGITAALALSGCGTQEASNGTDRLQVVATTGILADLARNVAGDAADVTSLVPEQGDPHSYEPSLRDVRTVAYADVAFSNYLMLEQHSVIKTLDANLRPGATNISLAEASTKYGAEVIPLVENANLDTLWLGLRVRGTGAERGATRASEVEMAITKVEGPGVLSAYLTETFGRPKVFSTSRDGFDASTGYADDTMTLPVDAHTHMSWAFSEPGLYRATVRAQLRTSPDAAPQPVGEAVATFLVGKAPAQEPQVKGMEPLDIGHADLTAELDSGKVDLLADAHDGRSPARTLDLAKTVLVVPPKALTEVPGNPEFRFLGRAGTPIHQLPQAVLGAHVHGEIDPHLWLSAKNAKAYVRTIADTLAHADAPNASRYHANANAYLQRLTALDRDVAKTVATIPASHRHLVTTHDAYAYFAKAYGLKVAGFVTPNPSVEPSLTQRRKLAATIRQLQVPAVFLEPALARKSSVLRTIAGDLGVQVCAIRSDSFDQHVHTYVDLMRTNADSLARCLR